MKAAELSFCCHGGWVASKPPPSWLAARDARKALTVRTYLRAVRQVGADEVVIGDVEESVNRIPPLIFSPSS